MNFSLASFSTPGLWQLDTAVNKEDFTLLQGLEETHTRKDHFHFVIPKQILPILNY